MMHPRLNISFAKATSIEHKTRGVLHGLSLDLHRPLSHTLPSLLQQVVSFTTDLGTESGIIDYTTHKLQDILPEWLWPQFVSKVLELDVSNSTSINQSPIMSLDVSGTTPFPYCCRESL